MMHAQTCAVAAGETVPVANHVMLAGLAGWAVAASGTPKPMTMLSMSSVT